MKNITKVIISSIVILVVFITGVSVYANYECRKTANNHGRLNDRGREDVRNRQEIKKNNGALAGDDVDFEEFRAQRMQSKIDRLQSKVDNGEIDQQTADQYIEQWSTNQMDCDGDGTDEAPRYRMNARLQNSDQDFGNYRNNNNNDCFDNE